MKANVIDDSFFSGLHETHRDSRGWSAPLGNACRRHRINFRLNSYGIINNIKIVIGKIERRNTIF
jgi:hypothetical protein